MARFHQVGDVFLDVDAIVAVNLKDKLENGTPCSTVHLAGGHSLRFLDYKSERALAELVARLPPFREDSGPRLGRT